MKTVTFDEACMEFEKVFQLAAGGETVVIQRNEQRVTLRPLPNSPDLDVAPPNYFAGDYSDEELAELNALASQAPQNSVP